MYFDIGGTPGIGATVNATAFAPFLDNDRNANYIDGGRFLDKSSYDFFNPTASRVIRPGTILGKITATGKYAPTILGIVTANAANGATSVTISAAASLALAARMGSSGTGTITIVGPPSAAGTVAQQAVTYSAVNTSTGVLTVTALSSAYVLGSIIVSSDGSGLPICLLGGNDYGIAVVDQFGTARDAQAPRLVVSGQIISKNVPGLLSGDASTIAYLKSQLNSSGRSFIWNDEY